MKINEYFTRVNYNKLYNKRNKYIVIHYTANNGDTALGNCQYFYSTNRDASAHYFVDENSIYQCVKDSDVAWHCGANSYKHPYCRNSNSIGVELCSRKTNNYYFKDETVTNAIMLVKYLMKKYNIPIENVIRHYDVTGKICPEPFVRDTKAWQNFKARLIQTNVKEENEVVEKIKVKINGKEYLVNRILKDNKNYVCLKDLEQAGFDVGYDVNTKIPSLTNRAKELNITVDGNETSVEAVNINGNNFMPIRSIASATKAFNVDYKDGKVVINKLINK